MAVSPAQRTTVRCAPVVHTTATSVAAWSTIVTNRTKSDAAAFSWKISDAAASISTRP